jgi:DNA-binding FadR family transcriptional regulator
MDELHTHLLSQYRQTGRPFFKLTELQNRFGIARTRQALNHLFTQGIIAKREGGNTPLVELLKREG